MNQILLMNKDKPVALYDESMLLGNYTYTLNKQYDAYLPYGYQDMDSWLDNRPIAKHREHIKEIMKRCGCDNVRGYIDIMHATSLNDTFWVKDAKSDLMWKDVSLYTNTFDEAVARAAFDGNGLHGIQFSKTKWSAELETPGMFQKCWVREDSGIHLIKAGSEGFVNAGMEPYSEKLVSDMFDETDVSHVQYSLCNYYGKLSSKCALFTDENTGYVTFAAYLQNKKSSGSLPEIFKTVEETGVRKEFYHMLALDAATLNTDRHLGNFGFLVDNDNGQIKGFAPLFDHNMALMPRAMEQDDWKKEIDENMLTAFDTKFIDTAQEAMREYPEIQDLLINLKKYEYENTGYDFPDWRVDRLNEIKDYQISSILNGRSQKELFVPGKLDAEVLKENIKSMMKESVDSTSKQETSSEKFDPKEDIKKNPIIKESVDLQEEQFEL